MKKKIRNLIIFAVVSIGGGFLGLGLDRMDPPDDPMQGLGALLWLVSPLLANLLLRALGGDGWKDFGLKPHFKESWRWYLVSLVIAPVVILLSLGVGALAGGVSLAGFQEIGLQALLPLMAAAFGGAMIKNIFEEFAWRGYLTPRLEAMGVHPFLNSLLTGLVWAAWHIPYYLYFLDRAEFQAFTHLSVPIFILLAFFVLPFHALAYGELRLLAKSVWPAWLLHNIANAVTLPLISFGFMTTNADFSGLLLSPGTAGILHSLLMGAVGYGLYRIRKNQKRQRAL